MQRILMGLVIVMMSVGLTGCWSEETMRLTNQIHGSFWDNHSYWPVYYSRPVCDKKGCWVH